MFPGVNSRQAQAMMRRMGMNQSDLDAKEVIIILEDRKLVFKNPSVSKISMMGQETYQLVGTPQEAPLDDLEESAELIISDEDIKTVAEQAKVSKEDAKKAIEETNGDLAEAIMKLAK